MSRFSNLYGALDAAMLEDAYNAITECDLWDWLKTYEPEDEKGFMFSDHPNLDRINNVMNYYDGHSGSSYGWTMRNMECIAKNGWDEFVRIRTVKIHQKILEDKHLNNRSTCFCQAAKGLSGWCGVAGGGVPACDH